MKIKTSMIVFTGLILFCMANVSAYVYGAEEKQGKEIFKDDFEDESDSGWMAEGDSEVEVVDTEGSAVSGKFSLQVKGTGKYIFPKKAKEFTVTKTTNFSFYILPKKNVKSIGVNFRAVSPTSDNMQPRISKKLKAGEWNHIVIQVAKATDASTHEISALDHKIRVIRVICTPKDAEEELEYYLDDITLTEGVKEKSREKNK
ncbi:MAG: hypothetical protein V1752_00340 [Candidatus Firestonebacteria bacterium]